MFSGVGNKLEQLSPAIHALTKERLYDIEKKLVAPEEQEGEGDNEEEEAEGSETKLLGSADPILHNIFTQLSDLADTVSLVLFTCPGNFRGDVLRSCRFSVAKTRLIWDSF